MGARFLKYLPFFFFLIILAPSALPAAADNEAGSDLGAAAWAHAWPAALPGPDLGGRFGAGFTFGDLTGKALDAGGIEGWVLRSGLLASPSFPGLWNHPGGKGGLNLDGIAPGAGIGHEVSEVGGSVSAELLDQSLSMEGELALESHGFDDFSATRGQAAGFTTIGAGLGASFLLTPNWSLGASVSIRDTQGPAHPGQASLTDWLLPRGLTPSDLRMATAGIEYLNPGLGTRAALSGFFGAVSPGGVERLLAAGVYGRDLAPVDLRGLEISLQQSLLEDRLSLKLAAMLNYLDLGQGDFGGPPESGEAGRNLSAYLAMTYQNPSLVNASLLYRYSGDGLFVGDGLLAQAAGPSLLDARIWRNFSLTPSLTLSTQLYGSSLMGAYLRLNRSPVLSLLDNYVEGRVTMSYAF
ncbi:MAG: hypothetical protein LBP92_09300 [Deltaproteobacteria bacterium]|jgi:hypothetical protein|nr:hypothetical protein [Deltaproteobacteria bacterium]